MSVKRIPTSELSVVLCKCSLPSGFVVPIPTYPVELLRYIKGLLKAAHKRKSPASFLNVAVLAPPSINLPDEFKNIV